ncbi:MAG: GNAT family N-acetyltransferase [Oscillospiraceae bacterium]|nr:GNAT family N-acetyltransferase [Oscillospiraceae bacterium]
MKIEIRPITEENASVLSIPNDPFLCEGRVVPLFDGSTWDHRIERFPESEVREECFPDENYSFDGMGEGFHGLAVYADGVCAGFAVLYEQWNRWLYLDNILISGRYRGMGLGSALVGACIELAVSLDKIGVWAVCQDDNLRAAEFYFMNGFVLGGMDQPVYEGTKQEGKTDIYLYRRA